MFILLPILTFLFMFLCVLKKGHGTFLVRSAFLFTALLQGFLIFLSTEALSYFYILQLKGMIVFWGATTVLSLITLLNFHKGFDGLLTSLINRFDQGMDYLKKFPLSSKEKFLITLIIIILALTGLTALLAPPNNWDSMTYHMSRVAHWAQNKTLTNYTTNISRQLTISPFAEYFLLQLQILSGSDHYANLIQFFSFFGCIIGVSLISKLFGGDRYTQILSSLLCATIPMAILQSSSTQNDLVSAFWGVCFLAFFFLGKKNFCYRHFVALSLSFAFSLLTKSSSLAFLSLFLCVYMWETIKKNKLLGVFSIFWILIIAFIINIPHVARTKTLDKSITDQASYKIIKPGKYGIRPTLSNVIKNIKVHMVTPSAKVNQAIDQTVVSVHKLIGIDVDDPELSYADDKKMHFKMPLHEDHAGNFLHTLMIFFCLFASFKLLFKKENEDIRIHAICLLCGFLIFTIFCKWQPWISRLQLPLFIYFTPLCSITLTQKNKYISFIIGIVLFLASLPWMLKNESRPMIGPKNIFNRERTSQYFANRDALEESYKNAAEYITSLEIKNLGILCSPDDWEYPIWILLKSLVTPSLRIEHIVLNDPYPTYPLGKFHPEGIISFQSNETTKLRYQNIDYVQTRRFLETSVFIMTDNSGIKQNVFYQFQELLTYLSRSPQYNPADIKSPQEFTTFYREYINQVKILDLDEIQKIDTNLFFFLKEVLLPSLEIKLMGYVKGDQKKYLYGESLYQKWEVWISTGINRILQKFEIYLTTP